MPRILLHPDAQSDLAKIKGQSPNVAAKILVTLQEIKADERLVDSLTIHRFGKAGGEKIGVTKWLAHWYAGRALWSLKIWELENMGIRYRVIYYFAPLETFYVLGIVPRSFDYDDDHPLTKRILAAYDAL